MRWLGRFVTSLGNAGHQYGGSDAVAVVVQAPLLSDYQRLPWTLQVLYGLWAVVGASCAAAGGYALYLRIASQSTVPTAAGTVLVVGGLGLLCECALGIELDAKR